MLQRKGFSPIMSLAGSEEVLPQFVPGSSSDDDDDRGQRHFLSAMHERNDDPAIVPTARRRVTFSEDPGGGTVFAPSAGQESSGPHATSSESRASGSSSTQQPARVDASRKRNRQKNMTSQEVNVILQQYWRAMDDMQNPFRHAIDNDLSDQAKLRRRRLVNTSNWGADVDDSGTNVDDVLLPESLTGHVAAAAGAELFCLKQHQVRGIRFMWRLLVESPHDKLPAVGCILAHSMGLGKTCQVIVFIHLFTSIMNKRARASSAVPAASSPKIALIVPKSTRAGWEGEVTRWGAHFPPAERVTLIEVDDRLSRAERLSKLKSWREHGGVLLIGYEMLASLVLRHGAMEMERRGDDCDDGDGTVRDLETDLLVCDEAHRLKTADLQCVVALGKLHARRRLLLSGTPLQNHLLEYWSMVDFCLPKYFDRKAFLKHFVHPIEKSISRSASADEVARAKRLTFTLLKEMEYFVDRMDSTPLQQELPRLYEYVITVKLSLLQQKLYDTFLEVLRGTKAEQFNVLQAFAYASKICAHPLMLFDSLASREGPTSTTTTTNTAAVGAGGGVVNKYDVLAKLKPNNYAPRPEEGHKLLVAVEIIMKAIKNKEKTLVFSISTQLLNYFELMLRSPAVLSSYVKDDPNFQIKFTRIDGSTSGQVRASLINDFEQKDPDAAGGYHVFLLSTRAAGVGITLTAATRVIMLDTSFNPSDDRQAIGRAYRYGQTKPVYAYRLVCRNTIEHRIFDQKVAKEWLFQTVIDQQVVKRDALSGVKLQQIFLMQDLRGPDAGASTARERSLTDRCGAEDVVLAGIRGLIISAVPHSSFFENDDEQYGPDEEAYYHRYKTKGGMAALVTEDPAQVAEREAAAAVQRELVHTRGRTLTEVIEHLVAERARASPRIHHLLQGLGSPLSATVSASHPPAAQRTAPAAHTPAVAPAALQPKYIQQFAESCRRAYTKCQQRPGSIPLLQPAAACREHAIEISDDDDVSELDRHIYSRAASSSARPMASGATPLGPDSAVRKGEQQSKCLPCIIDVDDDDDCDQ